MINRLLSKVLPLVFGIILIVMGIVMLTNTHDDFIKTTGKIVEIEDVYDPIDEEHDMTVYVDYTADGKQYQHVELGFYEPKMRVGSEIKIKYDPLNPSHIEPESLGAVPFIMLGLGVVVLLGGIFSIIRGR